MTLNEKKSLRIYYQNVRGLRTKTENFYRQLCLSEFDIIALTETWLVDGITDTELFGDQYMVWRRDRDYCLTGQTRGGGVLIAVRKSISAIPQPLFHSSAEDLWVTFNLRQPNNKNNFKLHVCAIYLCKQNQGYSFTDQLSNFLSNLHKSVLSNPNDKYLIVGDFNLSGILWQLDNNVLVPTNICGANELMLTDDLRVLGLNQYNTILNEYGKTLDLVLCNDFVSVCECLTPLSPVDKYHPALYVDVNFAENQYLKPAPYTRYLFNKADFAAINREISAIDWQNIFVDKSLNDAIKYFYDTIADIQGRLVPRISVSHSSYPTWYTPSLKRLLKEKAKYLRKFKLYGRLSDEATFKHLRERVKHLEQVCYANYIAATETSIEKNPKSFWRFVKQ